MALKSDHAITEAVALLPLPASVRMPAPSVCVSVDARETAMERGMNMRKSRLAQRYRKGCGGGAHVRPYQPFANKTELLKMPRHKKNVLGSKIENLYYLPLLGYTVIMLAASILLSPELLTPTTLHYDTLFNIDFDYNNNLIISVFCYQHNQNKTSLICSRSSKNSFDFI